MWAGFGLPGWPLVVRPLALGWLGGGEVGEYWLGV